MAWLWKSCPMFLSINEIEKRRSLKQSLIDGCGRPGFGGGGNCVGADVDHEIYVVKISRIFVLSLHHSTGVELLEPTPGLLDNPYLDNVHCMCMPRLPGASSQTNSWDIRCRVTAPPQAQTRSPGSNTLATPKRSLTEPLSSDQLSLIWYIGYVWES